MSRIFVSYSRQDKAVVARLVAVIKKDGHDVSMDDAIKGGAFYREKLAEAIEAAEIFVIVLSKRSIDSDEVRAELEIAADEKKPIIPVLVEQVRIPTRMKHTLAGKNRIDLSADPAAGHESLRAALADVVAASPIASSMNFAVETRRVPPVVWPAPAAKPKAEARSVDDLRRAAIEAGQKLIDKYDELIERVESATPKSLSVVLPGTWNVTIAFFDHWTFTLEKSGAFKAERKVGKYASGVPQAGLKGTWAVVAEKSVEFTPRPNTIRSMPFDFTFGEIDRKQLDGTTNFSERSGFSASEDDERIQTSWSRA